MRLGTAAVIGWAAGFLLIVLSGGLLILLPYGIFGQQIGAYVSFGLFVVWFGGRYSNQFVTMYEKYKKGKANGIS